MNEEKSRSLSEKIREKIVGAQDTNDGEFISLLPVEDIPPPDPDTDKDLFSDDRQHYESVLESLSNETLTAREFDDQDDLVEALDSLNRNVAELTGTSGSNQKSGLIRRFVKKIVLFGLSSELSGMHQSLSNVTRILNSICQKTRIFAGKQQAFNTETVVFGQSVVPVIDEKIRLQLEKTSSYLKDRMDIFHESTDRRQTEIANWLHNATRTFDSALKHMTDVEAEIKRGLALQHRKLETALTSVKSDQSPVEGHNPGSSSKDAYAAAGGEYAYYLFETRGRGSESLIRELQSDYVRFFALCSGLVLDVGCGRGEFLELLRQEGIQAKGIDSNSDMVEICRQKSLDVIKGDAIELMAAMENESLAGIFAGQVVEHLSGKALMQWLGHAYRLIQPGGVLVFETINTSSPYAMSAHYFKDPTHCAPRHPDTYKFLTDVSGFENVTVTTRSPVDHQDRPAIPALPEELGNVPVNRTLRNLRNALEKTVEFVYAPCDILVYARKPEIES